MRTVADELDMVQSHLHDDGALWPRSELLRWYNDGYVRMLAHSQAVRRLFVADTPGRVAWAFAYEWEDRHCPGLHRRFPRPGSTHVACFTWELETVAGLATVNASGEATTQLWELAYSGAVDAHFRFALSRQHDRIIRVQWDDQALAGVTTRELDLQQHQWWRSGSAPLYWLSGVGRDQSVELFSIATEYGQAYELRDAATGLPRKLTGDRTYEVALAPAAVTALGIPRRIQSPDRQYAPQAYSDGVVQCLGIPRAYQSTVGSLALVQVIVPTRQLTEAEAAVLVPAGLRKYLRYFVLSRAFGRKGEGQQKTLAGHYEKRFDRGVDFFRTLANIVFADRTYSRQEFAGGAPRRLPQVHFPSEFERR